MKLLSVTLICLAKLAITSQARRFHPPIKNLVTFGDSYTDPKLTGDRGTAWPIYAGGYGGLSVFDFARAGATCSNALTPRIFPGVVEDEVPLFETMVNNGSIVINKAETMLTLWIGTNDVGAGCLLTGQQTPGVNIVNTTACAVNWIKLMYTQGYRNFLFQNMIPLNLVNMYSPDFHPNIFWTAAHNATEWNIFMTELVAAGNEIARLMLSTLPSQLPGAHIGLFSSFGLFTDMFNNPSLYLNGTAPLNVVTPSTSCVLALNGPTNGPSNCTTVTGAAADSYLWVDELHPGEQANRIVAREIVKSFNGSATRWTTWFG